MTTSATTPMTTISENPISNMGTGALHLRRRLLAHFAFDRAARHLRRWLRGRRRRVAFGALHPFLESLDRTAEILTDVAQLFRAEDQHDHHEHDQPVPDAQSTHRCLRKVRIAYRVIIGPSGSGPPMTCTCTCLTSWRPMRPVLTIVRNPSAEPCSRARRPASSNIR